MADRPNLLYIHSDQHCPLVTGCYGDAIVKTPNLDRLAASGIVMDSAYCLLAYLRPRAHVDAHRSAPIPEPIVDQPRHP